MARYARCSNLRPSAWPDFTVAETAGFAFRAPSTRFLDDLRPELGMQFSPADLLAGLWPLHGAQELVRRLRCGQHGETE
jgi:hypothetical protein